MSQLFSRKIKKMISIVLITMFSSGAFAPLLAGTIPAGTAVQLRLNQTLSSQTAKTGSFVSLSVVNPVVINGETLIKAGAQAEGQVSNAKKANIIGAPGSIGITVTSVTAVDGTKIPLQGMSTSDGEDKMVMSIVVGLLCIFGFLQKGGEGTLDNSMIINARTLSSADVN
tara:strand:+ start:182 stop:691 length:510 start_codon:yes stop_codon:yes gene_type:complete